MKEQGHYFSYLSTEMAQLMSDVVKENSANPFRRSTQVRVGIPSTMNGDDYYLVMLGKKRLDRDQGSFNCPIGDDRFLVFRSPATVKVSFLLYGDNFTSPQKLKAYDRLNSYFFDRQSIDPFIPDSYRKYSALYNRLVSRKAELKISDDIASEASLTHDANGRPTDRFQFFFDYTALYHSGSPLREEQKIKQRVIDYKNNEKERSVL